MQRMEWGGAHRAHGPWKRTGRAASLAISALVSLAWPSAAQEGERQPAATTTHFAFHNDFATNLHAALVAAGVARNGGRPGLFESGADSACLARMAPSVHAGWEGAVAYYAKVIAPAEFLDRRQYLPRIELAGFHEDLETAADTQFVEMARGFRAVAGPAYHGCRWSAQSEKNRRHIDALLAQLRAHEGALSERLQELYGMRWRDLPIRVDIVESVSWAGANSVSRRSTGGGHLLLSHAHQGPAALEAVFHEASHLLVLPSSPLRISLDSGARASGARAPRDLWHIVMFYVTGETTRRVLERSGTTGYRPLLYGILERGGPWTPFGENVQAAFGPYVAGDRSAADAVRQLAGSLPRAP